MAKAEEFTRVEYLEPLSDHFHKARKQLVLWSGILIAWEVVGIDISKLSGDVGNLAKALNSPQAIPWVLVCLVAYFAFRTAVEWRQCAPSRRVLLVSRIDLYSSILISVAALVLYGWQNVFGKSLVTILEDSFLKQLSPSLAIVMVIAVAFGGILASLIRDLPAVSQVSAVERKRTLYRSLWAVVIIIGALLTVLLFPQEGQSQAKNLIYVMAIGLIVGYFGLIFVRRFSIQIEYESSDLREQTSASEVWSRAFAAVQPEARPADQLLAILELN